MTRTSSLVLQLLAVVAVCFAASQHAAAVDVGDKPVLDFQAADGTRVSSEALRGKLLVVDFWATWCGPCMAEADHMVKLNNAYAGKGVVMIGISLDNNREQMIAVAKDKGFAWPHHFDGQGWQNKYAQAWGVDSIPATFIVSPEGAVLWKGHAAEIDGPLAEALKSHPPRLLDPKVLAEAKGLLDKAEAAMKVDKPADAARFFGKLPANAKSEKELTPRIEALSKQLGSFADKSLEEAEESITKKDYAGGLVKLKDVAKLTGLPAAQKAADRLKQMQGDPEIKAALAAAEKAEKEHERAAKADEMLAAAQKLQSEKKDEQAYAELKAIVGQYAGTEAAKTAEVQIKKYEANPQFVKRANEAAASGKANSLLALAANYKASGRNDLARQKYQAVIDQFPGTSFAEQAKKELATLKN